VKNAVKNHLRARFQSLRKAFVQVSCNDLPNGTKELLSTNEKLASRKNYTENWQKLTQRFTTCRENDRKPTTTTATHDSTWSALRPLQMISTQVSAVFIK